MKALFIAIAAATLLACASTGPTQEAEKLSTVAAAEPDSGQRGAFPGATIADDPDYWNEEICKREPVTGTRLTRARCHTRYDWARMQKAATESMRDIFSQPTPCLEGDQCEGP
ncbi:MAG TPA: hypothetical protein VMQ83_07335 [Gammaproteobacteria bacterium]|nr:hypothetical protein [Gammaproteobacteria bacterium]